MDHLDRHNDNYRSFDLFFDADVLKESGFAKSLKPMRARSGREMTSIADDMGHILTSSHGSSKSASAYLFFCHNERKDIIKLKPTIDQMELSKLLSERWAKLKAKEKEKYYRMYQQSMRKHKFDNPEQHIPDQFKVVSNTEQDDDHGQHHLLSPNLGSFADGNDLQGNITLPPIPSPTLVDVDHSFGISNIPSPSFH